MQSFWKIRLRVTQKLNCQQNHIKDTTVRLLSNILRLISLLMTMFKSDVQSVRLSLRYSYADAVATCRMLCQ